VAASAAASNTSLGAALAAGAASITGLSTAAGSAAAGCGAGAGGITLDSSAVSFTLTAAAPSAAAAGAAQAALDAAGSAGRVAAFTAAGAGCVTGAGFLYYAPQPPQPPPRPPWPPTLSIAPGASLATPGAGASHAIVTQRRAAAADDAAGTGASIGYALAALVLLWLPTQTAYTAVSSAAKRRGSVTIAVAMRCDDVAPGARASQARASLARASQSLALTRGAAALSAAFKAPSLRERVATAAASGKRFAAPSLALLLQSFFDTAGGVRVVEELPRPYHADVRKLLRKPLLAALHGPTEKPRGVLARVSRALAAELAWNGRELRHAWSKLKRGDLLCGRRAVADVGKVFRGHPGEEAGEGGAPTFWLFTEVQLSFGSALGAPRRAAAWRAALRSEAGAAALEEALHEALQDDAKGLEIDSWAETILLLMDDAPHSRLGGHRAKAAGGGTGGLDAAVARRGAQLLLICVRDEDHAEGDDEAHGGARRSSVYEAPAPAATHDTHGDDTSSAKPAPQQRTSAEAGDVEHWQLAGLPCDLQEGQGGAPVQRTEGEL
jgi:hypothetical protein